MAEASEAVIKPAAQFGASFTDADDLVLIADATTSEEHDDTARVSSHPVEASQNGGTMITDHVEIMPRRVRMACVWTNTPLNEKQAAIDRAQRAYDQLQAWHRGRRLVTVTTGVKVYQNMVLTSLKFPRDARTGQSVRLLLEFEEVVLVSSAEVAVPAEAISEDVRDSGTAETDRGQQPDETATSEEVEAERRRSWALDIAQRMGLDIAQ